MLSKTEFYNPFGLDILSKYLDYNLGVLKNGKLLNDHILELNKNYSGISTAGIIKTTNFLEDTKNFKIHYSNKFLSLPQFISSTSYLEKVN